MKVGKIFTIIFLSFLMIINVKASEVQLTGIMIDGIPLEGFDPEVENYDLNFPSDKEKVVIGYTFNEEEFNVTTGSSSNLTLKSGKNIFTITIASNDNPSEKRTYTLNIMREDGRSNDNTLATLSVASKQVQIFSDKYDYDVLVDSTLKSVEIRATTSSSKASFVQGYGERIGNNAVTLSNDERTIVEIKVQAENEEIRTYKITIIKDNYKNNDATLKSLKIKEKNFNFNSNVYEYNLEVLNSVDKINIEAIPNNDKAKVTYDKIVELKEGINNIILEVEAEDGTKKEYKLNITRKEELPLVENIKIEGVTLKFKPETYEYNIKTDLKTLNFKISLTSKTAKYEILDNEDLHDGSVIRIVVTDGSKKVTYRFKINTSSTATATDLNGASTNVNGGGSFLKKYEMYIGLISFGVGLLSLLIAILTRPKDSQIM